MMFFFPSFKRTNVHVRDASDGDDDDNEPKFFSNSLVKLEFKSNARNVRQLKTQLDIKFHFVFILS